MTGWYAERTPDRPAKAMIAVTLVALLLVAAVPVALLAAVVMMMLGIRRRRARAVRRLGPRRRHSCHARGHERDAAPAQAAVCGQLPRRAAERQPVHRRRRARGQRLHQPRAAGPQRVHRSSLT